MWSPDCLQAQVFEAVEQIADAIEEYRENVNPSPEI